MKHTTNNGQYIHLTEFGQDGRGNKSHVEINVTVWTNIPKIPKIEIYTSRGRSFLVEGSAAVQFAKDLKESLIDPILNDAKPAKEKTI